MTHIQLKDVIKAGIANKKTIDAYYIDVGQLITSDEFNFNRGSDEDYHSRAVKSLINLKADFQSNSNIIYELLKQFVRVKCPHCDILMTQHSGGGNSEINIMHYECSKHGIQITLSLPPDGISVVFKRGVRKDE